MEGENIDEIEQEWQENPRNVTFRVAGEDARRNAKVCVCGSVYANSRRLAIHTRTCLKTVLNCSTPNCPFLYKTTAAHMAHELNYMHPDPDYTIAGVYRPHPNLGICQPRTDEILTWETAQLNAEGIPSFGVQELFDIYQGQDPAIPASESFNQFIG